MAKRKNVLSPNNVLACFTVKHLPFGQGFKIGLATFLECSQHQQETNMPTNNRAGDKRGKMVSLGKSYQKNLEQDENH